MIKMFSANNIKKYTDLIIDKLPEEGLEHHYSLNKFYTLLAIFNPELLSLKLYDRTCKDEEDFSTYVIQYKFLGEILAKHNPNYLKNLDSNFKKNLDWKIIGDTLAIYNPEYLIDFFHDLKDYRDKLSWNSIGAILAKHNIDYLCEFKNMYHTEHKEILFKIVAEYHLNRLEEFEEFAFYSVIWDEIACKIASGMNKKISLIMYYLKKYEDKIHNWTEVIMNIAPYRLKELYTCWSSFFKNKTIDWDKIALFYSEHIDYVDYLEYPIKLTKSSSVKERIGINLTKISIDTLEKYKYYVFDFKNKENNFEIIKYLIYNFEADKDSLIPFFDIIHSFHKFANFLHSGYYYDILYRYKDKINEELLKEKRTNEQECFWYGGNKTKYFWCEVILTLVRTERFHKYIDKFKDMILDWDVNMINSVFHYNNNLPQEFYEKAYFSNIEKHYGNNKELLELIKQGEKHIVDYLSQEPTTELSYSKNLLTRYIISERNKIIALLGIVSIKGSLIKEDVKDFNNFFDRLYDLLEEGYTLMTSPNDLSLPFLHRFETYVLNKNESLDVEELESFSMVVDTLNRKKLTWKNLIIRLIK